MDPEFGEGFPQLFVFLPLIAAAWAGAWLEGEGCGRKEEGEGKGA